MVWCIGDEIEINDNKSQWRCVSFFNDIQKWECIVGGGHYQTGRIWQGDFQSKNFKLLKKYNELAEANSTKVVTKMNLVSKIKNLFRSEPEKSFIKVGVMDENGELTDGGKKVFIDYLFSQNKDAFNTAIVQPLIVAEAAEAASTK